MKASKMLLATLKEAPQEAQIASHILLIRAGMIKCVRRFEQVYIVIYH